MNFLTSTARHFNSENSQTIGRKPDVSLSARKPFADRSINHLQSCNGEKSKKLVTENAKYSIFENDYLTIDDGDLYSRCQMKDVYEDILPLSKRLGSIHIQKISDDTPPDDDEPAEDQDDYYDANPDDDDEKPVDEFDLYDTDIEELSSEDDVEVNEDDYRIIRPPPEEGCPNDVFDYEEEADDSGDDSGDEADDSGDDADAKVLKSHPMFKKSLKPPVMYNDKRTAQVKVDKWMHKPLNSWDDFLGQGEERHDHKHYVNDSWMKHYR